MQGARDEERWEGEAQSAETEWIDDVGIERPSAREDGDLRARHAQLQERQVPREATAPHAAAVARYRCGPPRVLMRALLLCACVRADAVV